MSRASDPLRVSLPLRVCLAVLSGPPGAGKTTFAKGFAKQLEERGILAAHVCYDELIPRERQASMALEASSAPGAWKEARGEILQSVRRKLKKLLVEDDEGEDQEDESLQKLSRAFDKSLDIGKSPSSSSFSLVVIVDDNNYLRSMRYSYFQMARSLGIGFCQFHFPCTSAEADAADGERPEGERVPKEAREAMLSRLEPPQPFKHPWERLSLCLKTFGKDGARSGVPYEVCVAMTEAAMLNPEREARDDSEERERDRGICSASVIHQADRALRNLVGASMKSSDSSSDKAGLAKRLNSARSRVLEELKKGAASLSKEVLENPIQMSSELESLFSAQMEQLEKKEEEEKS